MNRSGQGHLKRDMSVSTVTSADRTCYSLHTQPAAGTGIPTAFPIPRPGSNICTRSPDYECYKTGRPACCDSGFSCPSFMTMCDNTGAGMTGGNYCTNAPDFGCWPSSNGHPPCCSERGGATINCPTADELNKYQPCEPQPRTNPTRNVSVLFSLLFP